MGATLFKAYNIKQLHKALICWISATYLVHIILYYLYNVWLIYTHISVN